MTGFIIGYLTAWLTISVCAWLDSNERKKVVDNSTE